MLSYHPHSQGWQDRYPQGTHVETEAWTGEGDSPEVTLLMGFTSLSHNGQRFYSIACKPRDTQAEQSMGDTWGREI